MTTPPDFTKLPKEMTLPLPRTIEKGKGIASTSGPNKCLITYRGVVQERDKLTRAATYKGITAAMLHRCVVNDAADYILSIFEPSGD